MDFAPPLPIMAAMRTPLRMAISLLCGWTADRKLPRPLRAPAFKTYAKLTGASLAESRGPLDIYPSLGAFFVRHLVPGARPIEADPAQLPCPVDGTFQSIGPVTNGQVMQAKGKSYELRELLGDVGADVELEGGHQWTIYLSPRDYHRIHAPEKCRLTEARWIPGARWSVQPWVLKWLKVLPVNERFPLRLETERGPLFLVLVGALNVGRIRVLGVDPRHAGAVDPALPFERGGELARFEMGSTIVLIAPPGTWKPTANCVPGQKVKLGESIAELVQA